MLLRSLRPGTTMLKVGAVVVRRVKVVLQEEVIIERPDWMRLYLANVCEWSCTCKCLRVCDPSKEDSRSRLNGAFKP